MRKLVLGDVHGNLPALRQVLERSEFDFKKDKLIFIGDVYDRFPYGAECMDIFMKIENFIGIWGNHDMWTYAWLKFDRIINAWYVQGGYETTLSYYDKDKRKKKEHARFLEENFHNYHIDENNNLFIHGGFDYTKPVDAQTDPDIYYWDRELYQNAVNNKDNENLYSKFNEIFIGHTATVRYDNAEGKYVNLEPVHVANVWNVDQGAGFRGKLTMMDVDTKEFWQSDFIDLENYDECMIEVHNRLPQDESVMHPKYM